MIRDTEAHERALFTLAEPDQGSRPFGASVARRSTVHGFNGAGQSYEYGTGLVRSQRPRSAVATFLGGDLGEQIKKATVTEGKEKGEVDVDLLLQGAEKLCSV